MNASKLVAAVVAVNLTGRADLAHRLETGDRGCIIIALVSTRTQQAAIARGAIEDLIAEERDAMLRHDGFAFMS